MTLTASYQKVFSDDPKLGFFAQRDTLPGGAATTARCCRPPRTWTTWSAVVTNSTVDGVLAALFAVLIIIVILDAVADLGEGDPGARAAADDRGAAPSRRGSLRPAGLFPTAEERALLAGADGEAVRTGRFTREGDREVTRPRGDR